MDRKRIMLADDHEEFLTSIRSILSEQFEIVGTAHDGSELVSGVHAVMPDLIVSDLSMPLMNGFQAAAQLRKDGCLAPIILLTIESSPSYVKKALSLGVQGYVLKTYASEQLSFAIAEVFAGRRYISPQIAINLS